MRDRLVQLLLCLREHAGVCRVDDEDDPLAERKRRVPDMSLPTGWTKLPCVSWEVTGAHGAARSDMKQSPGRP